MQKIWYIELENEIIRVQADDKRTAMTEFHGEGYKVVWKDVKVVPAWEKEKQSDDHH